MNKRILRGLYLFLGIAVVVAACAINEMQKANLKAETGKDASGSSKLTTYIRNFSKSNTQAGI